MWPPNLAVFLISRWQHLVCLHFQMIKIEDFYFLHAVKFDLTYFFPLVFINNVTFILMSIFTNFFAGHI